MNKKIRLVGGPFGGKVENDPELYGRNEIVYRGPKKMTRKARYEYEAKRYKDPAYAFEDYRRFPQVEARYRISSYPGLSYAGTPTTMPAMHPDGSIFYEYVEGSRREFR